MEHVSRRPSTSRSSSPTTCSPGSARTPSPAPGFADTWERAADRVTFHIRDGMKFSDGTPATSQDVCFSWGLALAAIKDKKSIGYGYLDPGLKDAGVTKIECPDDSTFIAYTTDQSDRIFQIYVPILPKHVWSKFNYKNIDKEKFDAPLVGSGPYTLAEWKTNQFARFVRNPNYWGNQGFADEVVLQFYSDADTMVQALKAGELDYAHSVNADQFKQLPGRPDLHGGRRQGERLDPARVQHLRHGHRQDRSPTAGRRPRRCSTRRSATRSATPSTSRSSWTACSAASATSAPPTSRRSCPSGTSSRTAPATSTSSSPSRSSTRPGYVLNGDGKRLDKEGKPIALRLYFPNTDDVYAKSAQFVQEWYGQLGIDVTLQGFGSTALGQHRAAARGRRQGQLRHRAVGLGRQPGPERAAGHLHAAARSARRRTASTATRPSTPSTSSSSTEAGDARHDDAGEDAEPDLRRGAVRHPVLRREPRRLPQRQVRGLGEHARERDADVHLRHPQLHPAP